MKKVMLLLGIMLLVLGIANAQTINQDMTGDQEVPPVVTNASGDITATLDENSLRVQGDFEDLESDLNQVSGSSAHIHRGAVGENGPVLYAITLDNDSDDNRSGSFDQTFNLTDDEVEDFQDGRLYVNVHSVDHPTGEIRGQLAEDITVNETIETNTTVNDSINVTTNVTTNTTTNVTTNVTTNTSEIDVDLNIHPWYPKGPDYVFLCNHTGFSATNFTWFYGDGHKLLNIANQNTYHVYNATGTYTVTCIASDGVNSASDTITITVTNLTRPTNPLFGGNDNDDNNNLNNVSKDRSFSCVNDASNNSATCTCPNSNENAASCRCETQGAVNTQTVNAQTANANANLVSICHTTGNGAFMEVQINQNALKAHQNHGDIYPVPANGCINATTNTTSPPENGTNTTETNNTNTTV